MTSISTTANEMRKDYLINRWTVIATQRKKRPTDFKKTSEEVKQSSICALDPGNEQMTPPALLVYLPTNGGIRKDRDQDSIRHKNWLIRVVPNLYPAFTPPIEDERFRLESRVFAHATALGHHEVLIESPQHDEHPGVAKVSQLGHVVNAYVDRFRELTAKPYIKYVSIFRNHGLEAGASLTHAHTQLMATPIIPRLIEEELRASKQLLEKEQKCPFCNIIEKEETGPRFIWKNEHFVVFAPWASVHPFEFWVFPKRHQCCILDLQSSELKALARVMRVSLGGLRALLDDPPYNFGFHQLCGHADAANNYYHWHLEVYPRLTIWAGFEKSTGMFINVVSPEDAAEEMRKATLEEEKKIELFDETKS